MKALLVSLVIVASVAAQAWAFSGVVESVHDGDTITVNGRRVRLYGIDAPELNQPGGYAARDHLAGLVLNVSVRVRVKDKDDYGRTVGVVLLAGGRNANAMMVEDGHAWVYTRYCRNCQALELSQGLARLRGLGLWAEPRPVPPWQWRKTHRRHK